jgi:TonB-dependent Receptor Plug Domain
MKRLLIVLLLAAPRGAQSQNGELHLKVVDPASLPVRASVEVINEGNQFRETLVADDQGRIVARRVPFGVYTIHVQQPGFAPYAGSVEVRSELPTDFVVHLTVAAVNSSVVVKDEDTLIDPHSTGSVNRIGRDAIDTRVTSLPGRSLQDLIDSQPGWLYEGNAVLHPRGSEYQTQFVVDGIPLSDNRSPSFGPEIEADDVQSLNIYTAGIPAEYGRKMGGVVEVNTMEDAVPGLHGEAVLSGGSFDTAGIFSRVQYVWGKNVFGASAEGSGTDHYLNPVVPQNYTNAGTTGDFAVQYERDLTPKDRLSLIVHHELSRYELPDEQVQEAAGQLQTADNFETMGIVSYQHIFSSNAVSNLQGMVRNNANDFYSNPNSTPVEVFQHNWFGEGYFKGTVTLDHGRHEWKAGVESDNTFLNENFSYIITDPSQYDPDTPLTFTFPLRNQRSAGRRPDLEQAAFVEDRIRLGHWTLSAGLRWDHYQLLVNRQAVSPRVSIARFFPSANLVLHFSYDRVFQTPSFENILLSSSSDVDSIAPENFLRLPVKPSEGNYYEVGLTEGFYNKLRLEANYFRRVVNNYADDDQIDNTTISFPIAFQKAVIYGAEAKIEVPDWHHFSGFGSYSYTLGNVWLPVTGGLFLGDDATAAETQLAGHLPDSQDQRNTVRGRLRYQLTPRLWVAGGMQYDTGLPFQFDGQPSTVLAEYGPRVLSRINFSRGRIYPSFQVSASVGADLYTREGLQLRLQADGRNLTNVLDVIDFGGLFSGNAIGPSRSYALRLQATF